MELKDEDTGVKITRLDLDGPGFFIYLCASNSSGLCPHGRSTDEALLKRVSINRWLLILKGKVPASWKLWVGAV